MAGQVVYVPGRPLSLMAGAFAGETETGANDAVTIADTALMRRDFRPVRIKEPVAELSMLPARAANHNPARLPGQDTAGRQVGDAGHRPGAELFMAAGDPSSLRLHSPGTAHHRHERAGGCQHHQTLKALGRRSVDVLWVLLGDNRPSQSATQAA